MLLLLLYYKPWLEPKPGQAKPCLAASGLAQVLRKPEPPKAKPKSPSEQQGYGNPQGYRAGVCRGKGKGMIFETPGKPLPLVRGYGGINI